MPLQNGYHYDNVYFTILTEYHSHSLSGVDKIWKKSVAEAISSCDVAEGWEGWSKVRTNFSACVSFSKCPASLGKSKSGFLYPKTDFAFLYLYPKMD